MPTQRLRNFTEEHIRENCSELTGEHSNGLFYDCQFRKLNDLVLKDCDLNQSTFSTDRVRDALGFTMTLSCLSFNNVTYSETLFDLLLALMTLTKGNDVKREKLLDVIGAEKSAVLLRLLRVTE